MVDFNTPGDLSAYFSTAQSSGVNQSAGGGLGGSGSVDLSPLAGTSEVVYTFNQSFSGDLSNWNASLYFHGNARNFWQFGFTSDPTPGTDTGYLYNDDYLSVIFLQSGNAANPANEVEGAFGIGSYSAGSEGTVFSDPNIYPDGGISTDPGWYKYSMDVSYLGVNVYEVTGTMERSDADGNILSVMGTTTYQFTNPGLAGDDSVYLYFYMFDGSAIDRFTTSIPEPSAALLGGLGALALLRRRRI